MKDQGFLEYVIAAAREGGSQGGVPIGGVPIGGALVINGKVLGLGLLP